MWRSSCRPCTRAPTAPCRYASTSNQLKRTPTRRALQGVHDSCTIHSKAARGSCEWSSVCTWWGQPHERGKPAKPVLGLADLVPTCHRGRSFARAYRAAGLLRNASRVQPGTRAPSPGYRSPKPTGRPNTYRSRSGRNFPPPLRPRLAPGFYRVCGAVKSRDAFPRFTPGALRHVSAGRPRHQRPRKTCTARRCRASDRDPGSQLACEYAGIVVFDPPRCECSQ